MSTKTTSNYIDNVPDMSGPAGDGAQRVMVQKFDKRLGIVRFYITVYAWSTDDRNLKSSYNYYRIKFRDDDDVFFVKAPGKFDRSRLVDKIDKFVLIEYGEALAWDFDGLVRPSVAREGSTWVHPGIKYED